MIDAADMTPVERRFWEKVDIQRLPDGAPDFDKCWPWLGARTKPSGCPGHPGYGQFRLSRTPSVRVKAHRQAWEFFHGEKMSASKDGAHACDNPPCCNPTHVSPEPHAENWRAFVKKWGSPHGRAATRKADDAGDGEAA